MRSFRSILSLAFAFLVLVSSTSFMVGIHRCGGMVKNIALFHEAEGCAQEQKTPPCHRSDVPPCCQDVSVVHEHQDFKADFGHFDFSLVGSDAISPAILVSEIIPVAAAGTFYPKYDPPLRSHDRTIALQVFII